MASIENSFEVGDRNSVSYEDDNWQIREHCNRGYEPWFTLHKRRMWGKYEKLYTFVLRQIYNNKLQLECDENERRQYEKLKKKYEGTDPEPSQE